VPSSGVEQLDRLFDSIPTHSSLVYVNDPGVEADPFVHQCAARHLAEGGTVVYATTHRAPADIITDLGRSGEDVTDGIAKRLHFVDAFSALMGGHEGAPYHVDDPNDVEQLVDGIERAGHDHGGAMLIIDSLSSLLDRAEANAVRRVAPRLVAAMKAFGMTNAVFTQWPYTDTLDDVLSRFDAMVSLKAVEDQITVSQYFRLDRAAWQDDVDSRPRLYKVMRPGGIHVYIPKIVVTGPYNAGKSSLIHAASDTAVSVDHLGTTVALDHGRVTMDGLTADVFGTPGQSRFDPVLRIVTNQAVGVIVVVDSTRPESFERALDMLKVTWKQGLPAIIVANKQDLPGALQPDEVARRLNAPREVRVIGCAGQDRDEAREAIRVLVEMILNAPGIDLE